jgi:hypothetical protein
MYRNSALSISRERSPDEVQADALLADSPTDKKSQSVSSPRAALPSPSKSAPSADPEKKPKITGKNKNEGKGKAAKGDKPHVVAEESLPPAAAVAVEGAVVVEGAEGGEGSFKVPATKDTDGPAPLTSAEGGRVDGGVSSPQQDSFLLEWRAESEVLAWTRSATSSGSNTPTQRRLRGPVKDPFSIGTSISRKGSAVHGPIGCCDSIPHLLSR